MKPVNMLLVASASLAFVSVVGCAPKRGDLASDGILALERVPEKRGYWRDIHVFQDGEELVVTGYVRRFLEPGKLQIAILTANGERIAERSQAVRRLFRSSRVRHTRFEARFQVSPSVGSVIRLVHLRERMKPQRRCELEERRS